MGDRGGSDMLGLSLGRPQKDQLCTCGHSPVQGGGVQFMEAQEGYSPPLEGHRSFT